MSTPGNMTNTKEDFSVLIENLLNAASPYLTQSELDDAKVALEESFPVCDKMYQHYQNEHNEVALKFSSLPIHLMYFVDLVHLIYDYPQNQKNVVLDNAMKSTIQLLIQFLHSYKKI